jgi:hypothetical protein
MAMAMAMMMMMMTTMMTTTTIPIIPKLVQRKTDGVD